MSNVIIPTGNLPYLSGLSPLQKAGTAQQTGSQTEIPFAELLEDAFQSVQETNANSQISTQALAFGQSDDLHTGSIAAVKYSTAVNFASNLTSTAIRAYKELMSMQI